MLELGLARTSSMPIFFSHESFFPKNFSVANKAAETAFIIILSHYIISKFFIIVNKPIGFTRFQEERSKRKKKEGRGWVIAARPLRGSGLGMK